MKVARTVLQLSMLLILIILIGIWLVHKRSFRAMGPNSITHTKMKMYHTCRTLWRYVKQIEVRHALLVETHFLESDFTLKR